MDRNVGLALLRAAEPHAAQRSVAEQHEVRGMVLDGGRRQVGLAAAGPLARPQHPVHEAGDRVLDAAHRAQPFSLATSCSVALRTITASVA